MRPSNQVEGGAPQSLSTTIESNVLNDSAALAGIDSDCVTGQVVANNIGNTLFGVFDTSGLNSGEEQRARCSMARCCSHRNAGAGGMGKGLAPHPSGINGFFLLSVK